MGSLGASLPVQGTTDIPDKVMPIAIVGMSCRLPGESDSPQKLWDLLSTGSSGWSQGAGDRFNLHAFHHPVTEHSGTVRILTLLIWWNHGVNVQIVVQYPRLPSFEAGLGPIRCPIFQYQPVGGQIYRSTAAAPTRSGLRVFRKCWLFP